MELLESVGLPGPVSDEEPYCDQKKTPANNWAAEIDTIKGYEADPATLRSAMLAEELPEPETAGTSAPWDLFLCNQSRFPYQTHHLILKKLLPDHEVCVWLTDSPKVNPTPYKLKSDTNYSIDNWRNGYFLPFASTTQQWDSTTNADYRKKVCYEMMRRTKLQLHQGNHSSTDYHEEDDIETAGYKEAVREMLGIVSSRCEVHVKGCSVCTADGQQEVQPLECVVEHVNMVSDLLMVLIDRQRIFVSKRAANYVRENRNAAGTLVHPSTPYLP